MRRISGCARDRGSQISETPGSRFGDRPTARAPQSAGRKSDDFMK
jgi:hypothetical protein